MRDDMKDQGYSKEEEYFHRKDQELIAKLREKAQIERDQRETDNKKKEYWMRCPKCGSTMNEEKYGEVVLVDRCSSKSCGGVFFDSGELELLLKAKSSLLQRIFQR
jgi:hypothetical protein